MRTLSCIVLGDAAVTIRCAGILRERGNRVAGVITGDGRVAGWAAEQRIPCRFVPAAAPLAASDVADLAGGSPFDLLCSIHNPRILSPQVLALPRRLAVNYHDGPLPRYAGLHAATWAILAGETAHGITWHRMAARVDAGDVLLQRHFPIAPDDTAWTLSSRCTEAAIESFPELVDGLAAGRLAARAQDAAARTWFAAARRPTPGCVIPWDATAEQVAAFVRALDFGPADNPLGMAKLLAPDGALLVQRIEPLARRSGAPAGTLLARDAAAIEVATASRDVRVLLATDDAAASARLAPGIRLAASAPRPERLALRERAARRHEEFWAAALAGLAPLAPPGFEPGGDAAAGEERVECELAAGPVARLAAALGASRGGDPAAAALALVLAWLGTEIGQPFDVGLGEPALRRELAGCGWSDLFALRPPLRVDFRAPATRASLARFAVELDARRREWRERGTYALDLPARRRSLRALSGPRGELAPAVAVDLLDGDESAAGAPLGPGVALGLALDREGRRLVLRAPGGSTNEIGSEPGRLTRLARRFEAWLAAVAVATVGAPAVLAQLAPPPSVSELFRRQAARTPDAVALEVSGEHWTYGAVAARAARLAAALRRRGACPEGLIAIQLARLPDLVTAILGVLAAGAAFLALDPLDVPQRLGRVVDAARPLLALGDAGARGLGGGRTAHPSIHPISLADADEGPPLPAAEPISPASLAYVAFTSGSTGSPKGVAIEHGSLSHYIRAAGRRFALGPGERLLQLGSPAFDLAYEQIFGALCHGAALVGLAADHLPEPRELLAECARAGVTVLDLPTAVWEAVARQLPRSAPERTAALPAGLRLVVIGGEPATAAGVEAFLLAAEGRVRLLNTYGPTEATIVATWWEAPADPATLSGGEPVPIGRPIDGVEAHVLDAEGEPAARGEAGELWLGGAGLARGYHRRPDLTAARFVERPDGRRLYRTGDRACRRTDGELILLGRFDRQVKIAGRRVEPGEVEAVLRALDGVAEAAVLPAGGEGGPVRLQAWVVLRGGGPLAEVRAAAERALPAFLRPSRWTALPALPRTAAGKLDRRALREVAAPRAEPPRDRRADPLEAALAVLWERLLGIDLRPAGGDDFFALGGDSLAAIALVVEVERRWGRRIQLARFVRAPTLAALAAEIRGAGGAVSPAAPPSAPAAGAPASYLVDLQPLGPAPPLVCVHGLGGHLLRLVPLARTLAPEQPFLGLQSPGLDDEEPVPATIEALAEVFLAALRSRLGPGPYRLCGMSFGGIVAFEMARRLAAAGGPPALLVLFDTDLAEVMPGWRPAAPGGGLGARAGDLLRGRLRRLLGDRLGRGRRRARRLLTGEDAIRKANEYRSFTRVLRANERALERYRPGAYAGTVTYLAATARDPALYRDFAARTGCRLDVVGVPGDHLSMLEPPHVERVAAELRRAAAAAERPPLYPTVVS